MTTLVATGCGILLALGLASVVWGFQKIEVRPRPARRRARLSKRQRLTVGFGVVGGLVAYLLTGWFMLVPVVPLGALALPYLLGDPPNPEVELLSALDRWVRSLAATLPTGKSIADAIRSSRTSAPALLADDLEVVVLRLDQRWTLREALSALAGRWRSPDADAVLAALMMAAHRGGVGATATLDTLSETIQERLRALRDIEAERAKPRVVVRQVTLISAVVLTIALFVSGDFFAPYRQGVGQVILLLLLLAYLGSLLLMRRLTAPRSRQGILSRGGLTGQEAAR